MSWGNLKALFVLLLTVGGLVGGSAAAWGSTIEKVNANIIHIETQGDEVAELRSEFHESSLDTQTRLTRIETQLSNVTTLLLEERKEHQ